MSPTRREGTGGTREEEGTGGTHEEGGVGERRYGRDAGEFAGVVGLAPDWDRRVGELGIWLRRPFWGRGYAGEACRGLTRVAFERLDLDLVVARVRADNEASNRAMEKWATGLGGRREGVVRNGWRSPADDRPHDAVRYSVGWGEWAAADAPSAGAR